MHSSIKRSKTFAVSFTSSGVCTVSKRWVFLPLYLQGNGFYLVLTGWKTQIFSELLKKSRPSSNTTAAIVIVHSLAYNFSFHCKSTGDIWGNFQTLVAQSQKLKKTSKHTLGRTSYICHIRNIFTPAKKGHWIINLITNTRLSMANIVCTCTCVHSFTDRKRAVFPPFKKKRKKKSFLLTSLVFLLKNDEW